MASGPFTASSVPTITTNGGSSDFSNASPQPAPPFDRPRSLSPGISPTSSAFTHKAVFPSSPKLLPPILPAHVPKNFGINSGLMSTSRRSLSPQPMSMVSTEGISQNPAAILRQGSTSPAMSRLADAPATTTSAPGMGMKLAPIETQPPNKLHPSSAAAAPTNVAGDGTSMNIDSSLTSPRSVTSVLSLEGSLTATAGLGSEISPTRPRLGSISEALNQSAFAPQPSTPSTPFSPITASDPRGSISSLMDNSGSVSSTGGTRAKHECPNCHQTFTRHHNLKSHLLTHSHEKPFQCTTCSSRFRRLHDLKRHQKLHTGERPHVCSSCNRKFARGDALARHLRGEGGCAGRRTSLGGMPEEGYDPEGGDTMDGLESNQDDGLDDEMPDFEEGSTTPSASGRRTTSLPSSRSRRRSSNRVPTIGNQANHQGFQPPQLLHRPSHHTYPPIAQQNQPFHPPAKPNTSMSTASASVTSSTQTSNTMTSTAPSTIMSQALTDSPRPLSPGNPATGILEGGLSMGRNRSPSYSSVHQQAVENRRRSNAGATGPPPGNTGYSLPQPNIHPQASPRSHTSSLPAPNARPSSFSSATLPAPHSAGHAPAGLGNIFSSGEEGIWSYIQNMEKRIRDLEERNSQMETRLAALSAERHQQHQQQQQQQLQQQPGLGLASNNVGGPSVSMQPS